ncbi:MAG: low affinity iron permease family protein [Sphingomonas sp.]
MATLTHKLYLFGCKVSDRGANLAGHPAAIAIVAIFCAVWFVRGGAAGINTLTLILSVLAITLTQMVLNQQRRSEAALHMKIDELILTKRGARDELAGIEHKTEDELEKLRRNDQVTRDCEAPDPEAPRPSRAASTVEKAA